MFSEKGKKSLVLQDNEPINQPIEPTLERTINVIIGGLEVNGISYASSKRYARITVNPKTNSS